LVPSTSLSGHHTSSSNIANAKSNDVLAGVKFKKSKSMIRKSMVNIKQDETRLSSSHKQQQHQQKQQHQPFVVSEISARYRFGSKSNNYSTSWLKGNTIPVIKFKPIKEENVLQFDHTTTTSSSCRKCSASKKIKFDNINNNNIDKIDNLIFKSATIHEVTSLNKPIRKIQQHHQQLNKPLSSKSTIMNVSASVANKRHHHHHNKSLQKVVSVASGNGVTKLPPPPKTLTSKSVNLPPTSKLIHYKSYPIQLVQQQQQSAPCFQMPTFPPFCIKLQFKL